MRRIRFVIAFAALALGTAAVASAAEELRTWSDATGKFKIEAKFVSQDKGKITLEKADGSQFEIPLAKLSAADKKYVVEYKEPEDDPFQPKKAKPKRKVEREAELTEFDTADVKSVTLPANGDRWKIDVPKFVVPKLEAGGVQLPAKNDFWEKTKGVAVNNAGTRAVVGMMTEGWGGDDGATRFVLADLETGKATVSPTIQSSLIPLAVADNGTDVLVKKSRFGWSKPGRVEMLSFGEGTVKGGAIWEPHSKEAWESYRGVQWGGFLAGGKVATMSEAGTLTVWDVEAKKALYTVAAGKGSTPAVAPGGKLLAFVTDRNVVVLDAATGDVLATKAVGQAGWPAVAFSPTGARLAVSTAFKLVVWETATGEVYREMPGGGHGESMFVGEDRMLVGGNLYDLETKTALWTYSGGEFPFSAGGLTWFTATEGDGPGSLVPVKLPHPAALEVLRRMTEDPDFYVLKPGSAVKLDLGKIPEEQREKVRKALTASLEANGFKLVEEAKIVLTAWIEPAREREVTFGADGFLTGPPGAAFDPANRNAKTFKVNENYSRVRLALDGESIFETWGGGVPRFIDVRRGDTMEKVIRSHEKPNFDLFATIGLPKRLAKGQGNRPTLGVSRITPTGVK